MQLFRGFALIGLLGFGGVLPWARYILVDQQNWMDDASFTELLTLGQFFPGPNIANVGVIYGRRTNGFAGACLSVTGLYLFPTIITIIAGLLIDRWWGNAHVQQIFGAVMPVASGLMLGTVSRLIKGVPKAFGAFLVLVVTFILMAIVKLPLWIVLLICLPLTMANSFGSARLRRDA
ncbi:MAG: chromate transporter [Acidocella sp.]|nr:chromate transporter [Acidocella sp.]